MDYIAEHKKNSFFINYGMGYFSLIDFVIQNILKAKRGLEDYPDCSFYYLGFNAIIRYIKNYNNQGAYIYAINKIKDTLYKPIYYCGTISPLVNSLISFIGSIFYNFEIENYKYNERDHNKFTKEFLFEVKNNLDLLVFMNKKYDIEMSIFYQIYNYEYKKTSGLPIFDAPTGIKETEVYELIDKLQLLIQKHAKKHNYNFITIDSKNFYNDDFYDQIHFSSKGAKKFGKSLLPNIKNICSADR